MTPVTVTSSVSLAGGVVQLLVTSVVHAFGIELRAGTAPYFLEPMKHWKGVAIPGSDAPFHPTRIVFDFASQTLSWD
jgi:hypothetical protein